MLRTLPVEYHTVVFCVSYREVVACDKCSLLNRDCVFGVLLQSRGHGRNVAEKFVKITCIIQWCRVNQQYK